MRSSPCASAPAWGRRPVRGAAVNPRAFRDAPLGAGPESILPVVVIDSQMGNCAASIVVKSISLTGEPDGSRIQQGRDRVPRRSARLLQGSRAAGDPAEIAGRPSPVQ